jgi:hypothetical protein
VQTDYLVIGAGATAMAFVDTLLDETDHRVVMVDRRDHPGGHWNDAYPFVRLQQPSIYYGVESHELGRGRKDEVGPNAGFYELASKAEILAYYDWVLRHHFLPSGRVTWLPMSEYHRDADGRHCVRSLVVGTEHEIVVSRKVVDGTYIHKDIPSTHEPGYARSRGVEHVPVNALPDVRRARSRYTVVGSGKTGMDACLWLLASGVGPERLRWIVPRDPWVINRAGTQPFAENFESTTRWYLDGLTAVAEATSPAQLFERWEAAGVLLRLDRDVEPRSFRAAVLSRGEVEQLRRISDVVRLGRVTAIDPDRVQFENGAVAADPDTLYVDCTASAIGPVPDLPVFDGTTINLLPVKIAQPVASAALIAMLESRLDTDREKNTMAAVVPQPNEPADLLFMWRAALANTLAWGRHAAVAEWVHGTRLDLLNAVLRDLAPDDARREPRLRSISDAVQRAAEAVPSLIAQLQLK